MDAGGTSRGMGSCRQGMRSDYATHHVIDYDHAISPAALCASGRIVLQAGRGDRDRLSSEGVARQLYDAVGAKDKTLKIFAAEDSGVEHCQVDNRQVGADYIADWLAARLC